jgi:hypothetical protein
LFCHIDIYCHAHIIGLYGIREGHRVTYSLLDSAVTLASFVSAKAMILRPRTSPGFLLGHTLDVAAERSPGSSHTRCCATGDDAASKTAGCQTSQRKGQRGDRRSASADDKILGSVRGAPTSGAVRDRTVPPCRRVIRPRGTGLARTGVSPRATRNAYSPDADDSRRALVRAVSPDSRSASWTTVRSTSGSARKSNTSAAVTRRCAGRWRSTRGAQTTRTSGTD